MTVFNEDLRAFTNKLAIFIPKPITLAPAGPGSFDKDLYIRYSGAVLPEFIIHQATGIDQ